MLMAPRTLHKLNATRVRARRAAGLYEDGGGLRLVVSDTGASSKREVWQTSAKDQFLAFSAQGKRLDHAYSAGSTRP